MPARRRCARSTGSGSPIPRWLPISIRRVSDSVIVPRCSSRRRCYGERRQPNSPTHRVGCSPTKRCNRPRPNRWPRTGHGGWPVSPCTTRPAQSALSLRHCGIRLPTSSAAMSIRSGWRWPATMSPTSTFVAPVCLARPCHNVADVDLCRADALRPVTRDAVVLVDPARRRGGRRRFDPRDYTPALDAVLDVYGGRDLVVKCAPGIDFDELSRLGFRGEIEIVSLAGSVREACLWSARLAAEGVTRRATMLDTGEGVTDADPDDCVVAPAGRWIVDPDGAVVRAGLVRHYAARHGLWQLDPDIAYLSGGRLPANVRGFEVLEELNYSERRLRQALSTRDVGAGEILVRGVGIDPDALRARLRLRGSQPASVIVTRIGSGAASRATAFLCRPSR